MGISNDLKRAETMKKRDQVKKVITVFSKKKKAQATLGPSKEEIKKLMVMALEVTEEEKEPSGGGGDGRSGRRDS
jgi:hypothetical protein